MNRFHSNELKLKQIFDFGESCRGQTNVLRRGVPKNTTDAAQIDNYGLSCIGVRSIFHPDRKYF